MTRSAQRERPLLPRVAHAHPMRTAHAATEGRGGVFQTKAMPAAPVRRREVAGAGPRSSHRPPAREARGGDETHRHMRIDRNARSGSAAAHSVDCENARHGLEHRPNLFVCLFARLLGHMPREAAMRRTDQRGRDVPCQHVEVLWVLRQVLHSIRAEGDSRG